MKICSKCKIEKDLSFFSKKEKGKYGVSSICKKCMPLYYLKANPSKDVINMDGEKWIKIKDFPDYSVSNYGRVIRTISRFGNSRIGILKFGKSEQYKSVCLSKKGKKTTQMIHRLVAKAFIPNPNEYPVVNHIDGDKFNNHESNLEWCTVSQNTLHYYREIGGQIHNKKPVVMLDSDRNAINEFDSITSAAKYIGGSVSNIYKCCNGEYRKSYGYAWRFK